MLNNINNSRIPELSNGAQRSDTAINNLKEKNNLNNTTTTGSSGTSNTSNTSSSGSSTLAFLNAMIGEGGIEKLEEITDELEEQSKKIEEEIKNSGNKKYTDLSPLEQLMYNLDKSLENSRRLREHKNLKYMREMQFREYSRSVYGFSD